MSELRTDTITASDGTSPVTLTKQSAAKAWALDETLSNEANIAANSFNISSTTDVDTGDLHISFINVFSANNYCSVATQAANSANDIATTRYGDSTSAKDDLRNYDGVYKDSPICYVVHGDLA